MADKKNGKAAMDVGDENEGEAQFSNDEEEEDVEPVEQMSMIGGQRPLQPTIPSIKQACNVSVVSVISPDDFCILLESDQPKMKSLQAEIDKTCDRDYLHAPDIGKLRVNEYCFVYSAVIKKWCRAQFVHATNNKVARNSVLSAMSVTKAITAKAYLMDYNYNDKVYQMNIRSRQNRDDLFNLSKWPVLRYKCCLIGIKPREGSGWNMEAIEIFKNLVSSKRFVMNVKELRCDVFYCTLDYYVNNVRGVSTVADTMVFRDVASFTGLDSSAMRSTNNSVITFDHVKTPPAGASVQVVSVHIENPDLFYVYTSYQQELCIKTQRRLQNRYKILAANPEEYRLLCPKLGMPCVGIFYEDGLFYRSVIINIDNKEVVKVRYIDFGNEELVQLSDLYLLENEFLHPEALATPCRLDGIQPSQTRVWSPNAKNVMEEIMLPSEENPKSNTSLLMEVLAKDGEKLVVNLKRWKGEAASQKFVSVTDALIAATEAVPDHVSNQLPAIRLNIDSYGTICDMIMKNSRAKNTRLNSMIAVKVTSVESPDSFYVRIVDETIREYYDGLAAKMKAYMEHYADRCVRADEFKIKYEKNGICAFYMDSDIGADRIWHRGEVVERIKTGDELAKEEECDYKVYGVDTGRVEVVKRKQIFQLPKDFKSHKPYALKCCLVGLKPTGSDSWTQTAIASMRDWVTDAETAETFILSKKILKREDEQPEVISVDLIGKIEKVMGPFDPKQVTYFTFNQKLVNEGLAIPISPELRKQNIEIENQLNEPPVRRAPEIPDVVRFIEPNASGDNTAHIKQQAVIRAPQVAQVRHLNRRDRVEPSAIPFLEPSIQVVEKSERPIPDNYEGVSAYDMVKRMHLSDNQDDQEYDLYGPGPSGIAN